MSARSGSGDTTASAASLFLSGSASHVSEAKLLPASSVSSSRPCSSLPSKDLPEVTHLPSAQQQIFKSSFDLGKYDVKSPVFDMIEPFAKLAQVVVNECDESYLSLKCLEHLAVARDYYLKAQGRF